MLNEVIFKIAKLEQTFECFDLFQRLEVRKKTNSADAVTKADAQEQEQRVLMQYRRLWQVLKLPGNNIRVRQSVWHAATLFDLWRGGKNALTSSHLGTTMH